MKKNSRILNRFVLKKLIGHTTLGEVWLSEDTQTKKTVSLKTIEPSVVLKRNEIAKLKKEFKTYSAVKSSHIAKMHDFHSENGHIFYTMEFVKGKSLAETDHLSHIEILKYISDIAKGLIEIHNYGLVHGDIKPQDIVISPEGSAKLVDTGFLSYFGKKSAGLRSDYTYTAPEVINQGICNWRSDFYSLGIVLYESLFKRLPWDSLPFIENSNNNVKNIFFPLDTEPQLKNFISKLISPEPSERFTDAANMLSSLQTAIEILAEKDSTKALNRAVPIHETVFISRKAEMSTLMELLDNFEATSIDQTVIVEAPEGSGRTRFLTEFNKRIKHRNFNILFFSANQTQNLIFDLLKTLWESLDREYRLQLSLKWRGAVVLYFPQFGSYGEFRMFTPEKKLSTSNEDFFRLVSMCKDFVKMAAREKPVVLMLDNFDNVDKRSLKIIQEISSNPDNTNGLFTIVTIDPEAGSSIEVPAFSRIVLSPLTFLETREFIESALQKSETQIENEIYLWIYRNSRGLAKLIRSLLFLLAEEKIIYEKGSRILFKNRGLLEKGVEKLLQSKVSSLPPKERYILKAASVYLKFITKEALFAVVSDRMDKSEFESSLSVLESNYLISIYKNGRMNIVNKAFKPIIYAMLSDSEKVTIHEKFGDYIIETWQDLLKMKINHFAFAAFHYNRSGHKKKALKLYLQSVGGFFANLNSELAETSLDNALSIISSNPELTPGKKKYAVYLFAGRMYYRLGIYNKALPLLEKSHYIWSTDDTILEDLVYSLAGNAEPKKALKFISDYKADTKDKKAFKHYLRAYIILAIGGDYSKSYFHLIRAIGFVKKGYSKLFGPVRNFTLKHLQFDHTILLGTKDRNYLQKMMKELIEGAHRLDSKTFIIDALNSSYRYFWNYNEINEAYKVLHETLKLSIEIFDNFRITRSYLNLASCSHRMGKLNDVRFYLEKAIEYARKGCGANILKQCYINYGELALIRGELSIAENYLNSAESISIAEINDPDIIDIYSLQILLATLKNEPGYAKSIGGKLRRYFEQFENMNHSKSVVYYSLMHFLEALTGNDRNFFLELQKNLSVILEEYPIYKRTNYLLFLLSKIIYFTRNGERDSGMDIIHQVEQENISSSHSLYQMLYYYHSGLFLKEYAPASSMLKRYVEKGLTCASQFQSSFFFSLFDDISYNIDIDDTENIFKNIRNAIIDINAPAEDKKYIEKNLIQLQEHIVHGKNHIEYMKSLNNNYAAVIDIVKSIAGRTEINRIIEIVVKKVIDQLSLDLCGIVFQGSENEERSYLILDSTYKEYKMNEIRFKAGLIARMLQSGRIEFISGTPAGEGITGSDFRSVATVPVITKGITSSYFYLERDTAKGSLTESEIRFMDMLAENVAVIFDNVELLQIATTDVLTKLHSRRHFMSILSKEVEKAARYGFTISMILIDIDFFKNINDSYGHLAGDAVLKLMGKVLKDTVRSSDYVGRIGGEEFAILLTGTDREGAFRTAEKIRIKCEQMDFSGISATISAGVSSFHEDRVKNEKDFIEKSDMALYKAKEKGRNRVVRYSDLNRGTK
jgi:diguanylate cyclase (GGDEF)-like protein